MDGSRLRMLRKERNLTQKELGKAIHVSKVSISGYENGERTPDTDNLRRLADFFDVTTDYLLGKSDHPKLTEKEQREVYKETEEIIDLMESLPEEKRRTALEIIKAYTKGEKID